MWDIEARDLLAFSRSRPSVVRHDATLREVAEQLIQDRATREVYVVDGDGGFLGVITLRRLAHFTFSHRMADKSSATDLLELLGAETAGDLALGKPSFVRPGDPLSHVIEVMFRYDLDEIPVVDSAGAILGSLYMLDILAAWHAGRLDREGGT